VTIYVIKRNYFFKGGSKQIEAAKDYFYDMSKRLHKYHKLPVFQKSEEILELANVIAETRKEDDK
jgi:hypothetical protein